MYTEREIEESQTAQNQETPELCKLNVELNQSRILPAFDREKFIEDMFEEIGCYRGADATLVKSELSKMATVILRNQSTSLVALHQSSKLLIRSSARTPKEICQYLGDFLKRTASPSWLFKTIKALQITLEYEGLLDVQDIEKIYMIGRLPKEVLSSINVRVPWNGVDLITCTRNDLSVAIRKSSGFKPKNRGNAAKQIHKSCERWLKEDLFNDEVNKAINDLMTAISHFAAK